MSAKTFVLTFASAAMLLGGGLAFSQQHERHDKGAEGSQGMMGGGMMGGRMMNMMQQCERMMGTRGGHGLPQLPPGNEKLQLQMHAEIMQRMGEVLAKYAAQIK